MGTDLVRQGGEDTAAAALDTMWSDREQERNEQSAAPQADGDPGVDSETIPTEEIAGNGGLNGHEARLIKMACTRFAKDLEKAGKQAGDLGMGRASLELSGEADFLTEYVVPRYEEQSELALATTAEAGAAIRFRLVPLIESARQQQLDDRGLAEHLSIPLVKFAKALATAAYGLGLAAREQTPEVMIVKAADVMAAKNGDSKE